MSHKTDPHVIAVDQPHELDTAVKRMKKEGIEVGRDHIREAVEAVGHSRRKIYAYLREQKTIQDREKIEGSEPNNLPG